MKKISKSHNAYKFLMCFLYAERNLFLFLGGKRIFVLLLLWGFVCFFNFSESIWGIIKTEAGESFYVGCRQFYVNGEEENFVFTWNDPPGF